MKLFHTPLFLGITESEFETMKELHSMRSSFYPIKMELSFIPGI